MGMVTYGDYGSFTPLYENEKKGALTHQRQAWFQWQHNLASRMVSNPGWDNPLNLVDGD
jgi:hypothetical protein